jgi:FixJ family two-component response regulator
MSSHHPMHEMAAAGTTTLVGLRRTPQPGNALPTGGEFQLVSESVSVRSTPTIAVVDDDEDVRIALAELIRSLGYEATLFETADAFLATFAIDEADCIISDVHMPGTNGLKLAKQIHKTGKPMILITAFPSPELERQAMDAGVLAFLRKPFDPMLLINRLNELLG